MAASFLEQLAALNKMYSPIQGKLWSGTPISDKIVGKLTPTPKVRDASTRTPSFENISGRGLDSIGVTPYSGGQASGGGDVTITAPETGYQGESESDVVNRLRDAYGSARQGIIGQQPMLDQSYGLAKGDIETSVKQSEDAATNQKGQLETQYGDVLRKQLRTYQDLSRQRQGTFSALGTLDSSAFGEQQFRADQDLSDQTNRTNLEKTRSINDVESKLTAFKSQATSELSRLALQYQQGKNAIAQAISENNIEEAGAIASAIDQIRSRAQEIQNSVINFNNQASLLKAQGVDVRTNIAGVSGQPYADQTNNFLSNLTNRVGQQLTVPQAEFSGQGYIGRSGKRYNSRDEALNAGDI